MATVEQALQARLGGYSALAALVGARIYPNLLPQNAAYPAIAYRRVSAERPSCMGVDAGVVFARFQFDVWGKDATGKSGYAAARGAADQAIKALQRWRNASSPAIDDIFVLGEIEFVEGATSDPLHHIAIDMQVIYRE